MKPEQKYSLLHKYLSNQADSAEKEKVEAWAKHSKSAQKEFDTIQNIWEQSANIDFDLDPKTDAEWAKLKKQTKVTTTKTIKRSNYRWIGVAAVVLVLLGGFWLINLSEEKTEQFPLAYTTKAGETQKIVLADGSKVTLNASSRLVLSQGFDINNRIVNLEGEAWFEVTKQNTGQPFTINTKETSIKVLGTQFNVQAYPHFQKSTVDVSEGKVMYSSIHKENAVLKAGQSATYDKTEQKIITKSIENTTIGAWQKGILVFDDQTLEEVLIYLEQKFAVQITDQTNLAKEACSATFDNEKLEEILETIGLTLGFEVEQKGKDFFLKK